MPANIKPSRSRNTLIDSKAFAAETAQLLKDVDAGKLTVNDLDQQLVELVEKCAPKGSDVENPHSSQYYRSLQFTEDSS